MRRIFLALLALTLALGGPAVSPVQADTGNNWTGEYFTNRYLSGTAYFVRLDNAISFAWGAGSPAPGIIPVDNFSVRWTGPQYFEGGSYTFTATADDGVRVFVDDALLIDGWRDQVSTTFTASANLTTGQHWVRVEYYEATDQASINFSWRLASAQTAPGGWAAEYYNNTNLQPPQAGGRLEGNIEYNWGSGSPLAGINADNFSVRWWGFPTFEGGTYTFVAAADDGVRVYVDNVLVVDGWTAGAYREIRGTAEITPGTHTVRVEYFELGDQARISVYWVRSGALPPGSGGTGSVTATIATGLLNVRSGPSASNSVVTSVPQGTTYAVTGRLVDNSWIEITGNGFTGWVNARYVTLSGNLNGVAIKAGSGNSAVIQVQSNASLRIRRGPGTQHSRVAAFARGAVATVIGRTADSTWLQIRTTEGVEGWVSANFVTVLGGKPLSGVPVTG